jgi:2'-5' RNA ligase
MRLFIALELPTDLLELAISLQQKIQDPHFFKGTFPLRDQLHLTLSFLPHVSEKNLSFLQEIIYEVTKDFRPFHFVAQKLAMLPYHHPRLIWLSLYEQENIQALENLAIILHQRLRSVGAIQEHQYKPHVTLARIKYLHKREELQSVLNTIPLPTILYHLDTISLKQSHLSSQGSHYENLATYCLTQ